MENNKIIILGASGLVGRYLFDNFKKNKINVTGTYKNEKREDMTYFDIIDSSLDDLNLEDTKYAIICSAMVGVDNCFRNLELSRKINVEGIKKLIRELSERNIIPVYISSVFVFDGDGNYKENDLRNPANEYGMQKKQVEDFIIKNIEEYLIIRLGRVFGIHEKEGVFADALMKYKRGEEIKSDDFEELSMTYAGDIADGIRILIEKNKNGIYHIDYWKHKKRFDFVKEFFDYLGIDAKLRRCSMEEFNFLERRAENQFLDSSKFIHETGFEFTPIEKCYDMIGGNLMN